MNNNLLSFLKYSFCSLFELVVLFFCFTEFKAGTILKASLLKFVSYSELSLQKDEFSDHIFLPHVYACKQVLVYL